MDFSLLLQAIALGIVQGLTEFLPISSSAHLLLVPWLLQWNDTLINSLPFNVALHIGTLLSVLTFFADDWVRLIRAGIASIVERKIGDDTERRLAWLIALGSIPGAIVGALAESTVEEIFHPAGETGIAQWAVIAIAVMIALLGLFLFIAERVAKHVRGMNQLTLRDALLIGAAQALAIFPGVSRSGATITAGLFLGLKRDDAARFSFLLGAPIILGAGLKSVYNLFQESQAGAFGASEWLLYAAGFLASAITGFIAIKFLLRYLRTNSTDIFVYYRWALAAFIVIVALLRG